MTTKIKFVFPKLELTIGLELTLFSSTAAVLVFTALITRVSLYILLVGLVPLPPAEDVMLDVVPAPLVTANCSTAGVCAALIEVEPRKVLTTPNRSVSSISWSSSLQSSRPSASRPCSD